MSTLALFVSILPIITLSLFDYTQEECDYITIVNVYASSDQTDTLEIRARNDRTDNVFTTRACMPNPTWKIYDTRLTNDIKFYGEQSAAASSNPDCLLNQNYEVPKDSSSISTATEGDFVAFRLELWVTNDTNPAELACTYDWNGLITQQNICDDVTIEGFYFMDGDNNDNTADTLMMNVSAPFSDFTCSYFAYPTFRIYNNDNNRLWGNMDRMAQTYCLVTSEFPIINNATSDDGFVPGQELSMTIEFWSNWREFKCSWDWDGTITYDGSVEKTSAPSISPTVSAMDGSTTSTTEDPFNTPDNGDGRIVYHVGIVVSMLLLLIL